MDVTDFLLLLSVFFKLGNVYSSHSVQQYMVESNKEIVVH